MNAQVHTMPMLPHLPGIHVSASQAETLEERLADRAVGRNPYHSFFSKRPETLAEARARIDSLRGSSV